MVYTSAAAISTSPQRGEVGSRASRVRGNGTSKCSIPSPHPLPTEERVTTPRVNDPVKSGGDNGTTAAASAGGGLRFPLQRGEEGQSGRQRRRPPPSSSFRSPRARPPRAGGGEKTAGPP